MNNSRNKESNNLLIKERRKEGKKDLAKLVNDMIN